MIKLTAIELVIIVGVSFIILGIIDVILLVVRLVNDLVTSCKNKQDKEQSRENDILTETDEEFEARLNKIMAKDGNHMILVTALIEERKKES